MDLKQIVDYSAKLSMIEIDDEQREEFSSQIGKILKFVEKLNELDTSNIEPTTHILAVNNVTRSDQVKDSLDKKEIFKIAPDHNNDFYKVPKVIGE